MPERTLCEKGARVVLQTGGDGTVLSVNDGEHFEFAVPIQELNPVLGGASLQIGSVGAYCLLQAQDSLVKLEYGLSNRKRGVCEIPTEDFKQALAAMSSEAGKKPS